MSDQYTTKRRRRSSSGNSDTFSNRKVHISELSGSAPDLARMSKTASGTPTLQQAHLQFRRDIHPEDTPSQPELTHVSPVDPNTLDALRVIIRAELKASQDEMINKLKSFYENELKKRDEKIEQLVEKIDEVEAYSRKYCLLIKGIPKSQDEDTNKIVFDIANERWNQPIRNMQLAPHW